MNEPISFGVMPALARYAGEAALILPEIHWRSDENLFFELDASMALWPQQGSVISP
jgi:hypothetical protein